MFSLRGNKHKKMNITSLKIPKVLTILIILKGCTVIRKVFLYYLYQKLLLFKITGISSFKNAMFTFARFKRE